MRRFYIILTLALLMSGGIFGLRAQTPEGVVIAHTPKSEVKYIGSPSIAISPDGVIEGIESEDGRFVAVQWHPEYFGCTKPMSRFFQALVERVR